MTLCLCSLHQADVVLVDDYCHMMRWLSTMHSPTPPWKVWPRAELEQAYKAIAQMPRFQRTHGRDFAFFYSHPLTMVPAEHQHCNELSQALRIILEAGQVMRETVLL